MAHKAGALHHVGCFLRVPMNTDQDGRVIQISGRLEPPDGQELEHDESGQRYPGNCPGNLLFA
jgi:hypothetical protein